VDEHIIQCISVLADLEQGKLKEEYPIASGILQGQLNRRVLYVALLLHDIGKGLPEDHSVVGARIAEEVAPRLGLNEKECETVVWLVENHLLMSDTAQKRDHSDPRTVSDFTRVVKSVSRLKLLTVLTVCDILGVGPGTLNNWKAQLLRSLYNASKLALQDGSGTTGIVRRVQEAKEQLATSLSGKDGWDAPLIEAELDRHYDAYWQGLDEKAHSVFARILQDFKATDFAADLEADEDRAATRACFVLQDHPGIFSRMAGALALVGANVVDARTYTSVDGFATSVFWIQDLNGKPFEKSRLKRLRETILKTLRGEVLATQAIKSRDKIKKREREFVVPTEITFDNEGSEIYTIIEVDTRDRPGLLFDLARTLSGSNIYIASAVIATYGVQAVDVFYVKDMFGLKLHSKAKQDALEVKLRSAIDRGAQEAMS
jgi:[protein-PII] uridylyltransferase